VREPSARRSLAAFLWRRAVHCFGARILAAVLTRTHRGVSIGIDDAYVVRYYVAMWTDIENDRMHISPETRKPHMMMMMMIITESGIVHHHSLESGTGNVDTAGEFKANLYNYRVITFLCVPFWALVRGYVHMCSGPT